jgi:malate dehydrogenase
MERKDLLTENARIFSVQGKALNESASRDVRVLVVGNPANTNALIASANAPDIDKAQFTAMTRLDHNRAISQLAGKTGAATTEISRVTIWGNHSATQYPDIHHAMIAGERAMDQVDEEWMIGEFIPTVQQRGAAIIKARGASSAASAAGAAIDHMRTWVQGTPEDDWVSMAIPSTGDYGIETGLIYSFPVTCSDGRYTVVRDLAINPLSEERMQVTEAELREERDGVKELLG